MKINLTKALDFTLSNLAPKRPDSLHYIGTNQMNAYEKAIRQLFPVYGYGEILPNKNQVSHIFHINDNPDVPNININDNVLIIYK